MNKVEQSAAKPQNFEEGSQTISQESTLSNNLDFGSGRPLARNGEGDDIVENKKQINFIKKSKLKFGDDKFDYILVRYIDAKTKIKIVCFQHGEFEQTPDKHLQSKYGCPKCALIGRGNTRKGVSLPTKKGKSFDTFIEESNLKYNNKFNYFLKEE